MVQGETIAVDPSVVALGSHVVIRFTDGTIHEYIAEDTGGAIQGRHIDIFTWDHRQAIDNGVQLAQVLVIPKG